MEASRLLPAKHDREMLAKHGLSLTLERDFLAHITPSELAVLAQVATKILRAGASAES